MITGRLTVVHEPHTGHFVRGLAEGLKSFPRSARSADSAPPYRTQDA